VLSFAKIAPERFARLCGRREYAEQIIPQLESYSKGMSKTLQR